MFWCYAISSLHAVCSRASGWIASRDSIAHESQNFLDDPGLLRLCKLWKHRQGDDFASNPLRLGKISVRIVQVLVCVLKVQRNGIVNTCMYVRLYEMCDKSIP